VEIPLGLVEQMKKMGPFEYQQVMVDSQVVIEEFDELNCVLQRKYEESQESCMIPPLFFCMSV
jgi:hypothetical protein